MTSINNLAEPKMEDGGRAADRGVGEPAASEKESPSPAHTFFLKATYPIILILLDGLDSKRLKRCI